MTYEKLQILFVHYFTDIMCFKNELSHCATVPVVQPGFSKEKESKLSPPWQNHESQLFEIF